jgi:adenylylsulfate kinase
MRKIKEFFKSRAVQKSLTWRLIALIIVVGVALVYTGSIEIAGAIGFFDAVVKTFLYWLHEKAWERVDVRDCRRDAGSDEGSGSESETAGS